MPNWHMDQWSYLLRTVVSDPRGRAWTVGVLDLLGQPGEPEGPVATLQAEHASNRYFTVIYSAAGTLQRERAHASLPAARAAFDELVAGVLRGEIDPSQPAFREDLED